MKIKSFLSLALMALGVLSSSAQDPWLHIYYPSAKNFTQYDMNEVLDISFDEEAGTMTVNTEADGAQSISLGAIDRFVIGPNVCRIDIETDLKTYDETFGYYYEGMPVTEIVSKTVYLDGTMTFNGRGIYEDVVCPVKIRGRGNSTWSHSKKPYRLKFTEKQKLGNIHKAKNLVLLANYLDGSMMKNHAAFAFGKVIGMPFINRSLAVDVYLNGNYKGAYQLTEKVGINNGSVDLSKEDEPNSILFELDTNSADEDEYPSTDSHYGIPIRIKDPDAPEDYAERETWLDYWRSDLEELFDAAATENPTKIFSQCNLETLVKYVMVYDIACNQELNHPKSVYLHKTIGGLWEFGPCWDFDWAYGYQPTYTKGQQGDSWWWNPVTYPDYENPLIGFGSSSNQGGNEFFYALCNNEVFLAKFKEIWDDFYQNKQAEFWAAFDEYAASMTPSAALQAGYRDQYVGWESQVETLRQWIQNRFDYINSDPNYGLWED
ncbi:MAG: hypothetical protein HDS64_04155 [Bacteroidales bacterium]|nr:hypothetical protein [Bacteroidales bacterium]